MTLDELETAARECDDKPAWKALATRLLAGRKRHQPRKMDCPWPAPVVDTLFTDGCVTRFGIYMKAPRFWRSAAATAIHSWQVRHRHPGSSRDPFSKLYRPLPTAPAIAAMEVTDIPSYGRAFLDKIGSAPVA